ncbi:MAG: hypothetical protein QHI48_10345 [Bacteroidota bacterium]|nr:hypothetical protein [Bacteroidota bacterium]
MSPAGRPYFESADVHRSAFHHLDRLADRPFLLFACFVAFVLSITIIQHPPWQGIDTRFTFGMGIAWAVFALLAGALSKRPSLFVPCFLAACTGPHHRVAVLCAFACGLAMLGRVLWSNRKAYRPFFREAFRSRGFGLVLAIAVYGVAVWLARLGDSTDGWSFLALAASMFTIPLAVYSFEWLRWTDDERKKAARNTFLYLSAVALTVLLVPLLSGRVEQYTVPAYVLYKAASAVRALPFHMQWVDPDANSACFRSAHYAAVALFMLTAFAVAYGRYSGEKRTVLIAAGALFAALMGENAHALPAMAASALALFILARPSCQRRPVRCAAAITVGSVAVAVCVVAAFYSMNDYLSNLPKARLYRASFAYASGKPFRFIVGEGPASFGSHAARKRLPPGLSDERVYPFLPRTVSPAYRTVLEEVDARGATTTVHRPISGLVPFFLEWGLIGSILLLYTVFRMLHAMMPAVIGVTSPWTAAAAATAIASFPLLFVLLGFRPYLEYPDVMAVASVLFLVGLQDRKEQKYGEKTLFP